jgi:hypothetical protein
MSTPVPTTPFPPEHVDHHVSAIERHVSSSSSSTSDAADQFKTENLDRVGRPRLGSRKSSGTIIIPRDSEQVELKEEEYDDGDARTMSPRRSSEEIEKMGTEARQALIE